MKEPLFESHANATIKRVTSTFGQRGQEYGDTWGEAKFVVMDAVARKLGAKINPEHFRALATAAFVDMKYWRSLGSYKDDSLVDGVAYQSFLAEEMRKLEENTCAASSNEDHHKGDVTDRGNWFQTSLGVAFYHMDPRLDEINILDISHALSMICRFGGHAREFYSVAQHSVMVAGIVPPEHQLQALLHDASEAYVGDMVNPLKRQMPEFQKAEQRIWKVIAEKFGVPVTLHPTVKDADLVLLQTERRDLMATPPMPWNIQERGIKPLRATIEPLSPKHAREMFLASFNALYNRPNSQSEWPKYYLCGSGVCRARSETDLGEFWSSTKWWQGWEDSLCEPKLMQWDGARPITREEAIKLIGIKAVES